MPWSPRTWENRPQPKGALGRGDASDDAVEQEADLLTLRGGQEEDPGPCGDSPSAWPELGGRGLPAAPPISELPEGQGAGGPARAHPPGRAALTPSPPTCGSPGLSQVLTVVLVRPQPGRLPCEEAASLPRPASAPPPVFSGGKQEPRGQGASRGGALGLPPSKGRSSGGGHPGPARQGVPGRRAGRASRRDAPPPCHWARGPARVNEIPHRE